MRRQQTLASDAPIPFELPARSSRGPADPAAVRERWSPRKKLAFQELDPIAICLVATDGPVSVVLHDPANGATTRIGHNRGIWPAKVTRTASWRDTTTPAYDKGPFFAVGVKMRIWFGTELAARTMLALMGQKLAALDEEHGSLQHPLRHDFRALPPETDLDVFELEMRDLATKAGKPWWDDDGLSAALDAIVEGWAPARGDWTPTVRGRGRA
jgi:hypothetical protein